MKKFIVALATIAMTAAFSVQAQNDQPRPQSAECPQAQCEQAPGNCMFEGLDLTDAQKEQLKALKQKRKDAKKAEKAREKASKKDKKDKKQAKLEARKAETREYLAEVKAILTPEQYVQFLENAFINNIGAKYGPRMMNRDNMRDPRCPRGPQVEPQAPEVPQDF